MCHQLVNFALAMLCTVDRYFWHACITDACFDDHLGGGRSRRFIFRFSVIDCLGRGLGLLTHKQMECHLGVVRTVGFKLTGCERALETLTHTPGMRQCTDNSTTK